MSNSLDSFLTRIGDVTIERVTPRAGPKPNEAVMSNETSTNTNMNNVEPQTGNDESSEESSGETSDGEHDKRNDTLQSEEIEEIRSEGSGDDMDLDETIDSQIGVRLESERQHHSPPEEDDEEPVNILDTLPLEGAPIEGQEVSEADLLGKPISKDTDDEESIGHENDKHESHSMGEESTDSNKRHADSEHSDTIKKKQKKDDGTEGSTSECETKAEKKLANMRRNIREVMDETQLDEATLSAQRQEMERLRRVQEQQRIIREVQRQIAINRQNNKTQTRVISLLQGKQNQAVANRPTGPNMLQQRIRMMTPSVSISPVVPKKEPMDRSEYYSDSEISDLEAEEALPKGKDVVTISSSSESSDDDCIVLSDPSGEEETDNEDDPSNSGMHTNDRYNIPDEHGRVLINVGHPETEPDVFLAPQVARIIKPHQIGGIRFLYDNIVESIERFKTSSGFGCILAHSMGLGKTLQVASFCDIFFRCTTAKTVLCIMPINTLQNWLAEFNMWLPYEDPNAPEKHGKILDACIGMEMRPRHFRLHILNDSHKTMTARAKIIQDWQVGGGVLLIGYELYRQLSLKKPNKAKRKRGQPFKDTVDVEEEDKNKGLLDEMHTALVNPGPDLVICDEGHRIKNSHASISMALKQMRTKRRIVLTGYPLQNNLLEYWCMVDFVRPNYLGTKSEFCNMFERPIQNGQCIDSTPQDIRLMRYRAHVLHALLEGFVQRRSHSVLQVSLPRKEEYILLVRMTPHQRKLYDTFMNQVVKTRAVPNPLKAFAVCCKIWNHPDILYHFLRKRQANEEDDLDLEETMGEKPAPGDQNQGNNYEVPGMFSPNPSHEFSTDRQSGGSSTNSTNNYPVNQTQPQNSVLSNYSSDGAHQNQVNQMKGPEDPYWQRNYSQSFQSDQCNDPYYRDVNPNVNRYQNNYFPSQNYQNQSYDYSNNHNSDINTRSDESKSQQPSTHIQNSGSEKTKGNKEMTSSVGVQSQTIHQNNLSTSSGYSSESNCQTPVSRSVQSHNSLHSPRLNQSDLVKEDEKDKEDLLDKDKEDKSDDEILTKDEEKDCKSFPSGKEDPGIPYDWATELMKGYVPGLIDASAKMTIFFCILEEAIKLGDRVLAFSQSYGQQKPCFVYRLVTDNCLERKIYDRQISKQGMADRVVDQCNPDAHLSLKEATTLSWDWEEDSQVQDFSQTKDSYTDEVMHRVLERHSSLLTKQPFHHESLLVDRKDKKLSQAEKRLARRGYELEKMAANCSRPSYNYVPGNTATRAGGLQIRAIRGGDSSTTSKPVASVRPMQQRGAEGLGSRSVTGSRWIPAEVWQRQGMSAQEMTLPLDVVIPTNSPDKGSIVLKAGQRVMVLKSPKGIYMQLESGKIIAIRTALKLNQQKREEEPKKGVSSVTQRNSKPEVGFPLRNNSAISIIPKSSSSNQPSGRSINKPGSGPNYRPFADKEASKRPKPVATATAKPYLSQVTLTNQVSLQRLPKVKQEPVDHSTLGENSNSSDGQVRTEQRVEEVRLEDVVAEVSSNTDYSPPNHNRVTNSDTDTSLQKSSEENNQVYTSDSVTAQSVQTQHDQTETELSSKIDKQCSPLIEKEITKTADTLTNYGHSFPTQTEKRDASSDDIIIEDPSPQIQPQVPSQIQPQVQSQVSPQVPPQVSLQVPPQLPSQIPLQISPQLSSQGPPQIPPQAISQAASQVATQSTSSGPLPPLLTQSIPSTMQVPPTPALRGTEISKSITDSTIGSSTTSMCTGTNTMTSPKTTEPSMRESSMQSEPPNVPQGYPYAQYPRYYDYSDPRSRSLSTPYGTYFPGVPPHAANPRLPMDTAKAQPDLGKPMEERTMMNVPPAYSQVPNTTAKTLVNTTEAKGAEAMVTTTVATTPTRDDTHIPTAFSHPTSSRYPGPYPPGPYDPYSQHYPPAPGSSATYPPGGAPGYPAYGGPSYNTEYARMYTAFHGPPPPADPYIHRSYAPPSSHPPNYYPPFPHPPPPYPNYSFLSPYPNPNMPSEPQPPAQ
ncbi:Helicase ARIP4 [Habropoda laboriosa]|uniref:Helicase ARIP4 n=1 Tax=Habropoda laboriosa TaxID=597456 RepID=A0A0L7R012_9HYME|nr:Helicase ARIP4 [Habropoda laboriosa]